MDSPCIKQTVCKVLKIFQHGKYLVAYVLNYEKAIRKIEILKFDYVSVDSTVNTVNYARFFFQRARR